MAMKRVRATVATNAPLDVYGGFRAPDSILEGLAAALRNGQLPFTFNHDALKPIRVSNFDAGVQTVADGSKHVWAEFDIDEDDWAMVAAETERYGMPGGVSWSMSANPQQVGAVDARGPRLRISADAGFFDADRIAAAAVDLAKLAPLEISEIYQFGALPPPLVVIEIQQQAEIWKDFLVGGTSSAVATLLLNLLSKLLKPRHRYEAEPPEVATSFDFELDENGRVRDLHLRTNDPQVLKAALDRLPDAAAQRHPTMRFDNQVGLWLPPD